MCLILRLVPAPQCATRSRWTNMKIKITIFILFVLLGFSQVLAMTPAGTEISSNELIMTYDTFTVTENTNVVVTVNSIDGIVIVPTSASAVLITPSSQTAFAVQLVNLGNRSVTVSVASLISTVNWSSNYYFDDNGDGQWQNGVETTLVTPQVYLSFATTVHLLAVLTAPAITPNTAELFTTFNLGVDDGPAYVGFNGNTYGAPNTGNYYLSAAINTVFVPTWSTALATANGVNTHDGRVTLNWLANNNVNGTIYEILWTSTANPYIIYSGTTLNFLHNPLPDRTTQSYRVRAAYAGVTSNYSISLNVYIPDATFDIPSSNPTTSQNFAAVPSGNNYENNAATIYYYEQTVTKAAVVIDGNNLGINLNEIDFSQIIVTQSANGNMLFSVPSTSDFGLLVNNLAASGNTKNIPIQFVNLNLAQSGPLITVDLGSGPFTINQYGQGIDKDTIPDAYKGRINNFAYDALNGTLSFEVNRFSNYGLANITTINISPAIVTMSPSTTIQITVQVLDDSMSPEVENAPVTINIVSGTGAFISSIAGTTNASGNISFVYQAGTTTNNVVINAEAGGIVSTQNMFITVAITANAAVTQSIHLVPGYNLISVQVSTNYTAAALLAELNNKGASVTRLLNYQGGSFQTHLIGLGANNFAVVPGIKGYFVYSTTDVTVNVTGNSLAGQTLHMSLNASAYSLIGMPQSGFNASALATTLNNQISGGGGNVTRVLKYSGGAFQSHLVGLGANNFVVNPVEGYFIFNSGSAVTFNMTAP